MDIIQGPYYSFNHRILCITGQWPYLSKPQKRIRASVTLFILLSLLIPLWFGLIKAIRIGDTDTAIECFSPFLVVTISTVLFVNFIIHNHQLAILLEKIRKDWEIWSVEPEIEILKKFATNGKKFRVIYCVVIIGATTGFLFTSTLPKLLDWVKPLNESRPQVPTYSSEFGLNSEKYSNSILVHSLISTYLILLNLANADMVFIVCTQHASSISAAIGLKLSNLVQNERYCRSRGDNFPKSIENDIIFCVKQHEELFMFLQNIHKCFSLVYLFIVLFNILVISMTGVATVLNLNHPAVAFRFMAANCGQMFHILCLTIPCQQMSDNSNNISNSVYKSDWYTLPVHSRKLLLMIMSRSTEPCEFICGKLYTFSMKNFAMVMKTAISYFTVFCSMQ